MTSEYFASGFLQDLPWTVIESANDVSPFADRWVALSSNIYSFTGGYSRCNPPIVVGKISRIPSNWDIGGVAYRMDVLWNKMDKNSTIFSCFLRDDEIRKGFVKIRSLTHSERDVIANYYERDQLRYFDSWSSSRNEIVKSIRGI